MKSVISIFTLLLIIGWASIGDGAEWGRFRGPNASGIGTDRQLPVDYQSESSIWSVAVPGTGNSSPIIGSGNIYVTSAVFNEETKTGIRTLYAFSLSDGELRWQHDEPFASYKTNKRNGFASSSVCAGKLGVYLFWQSEERSVVRGLSHEGQERWSYQVGKFAAGTGAATSPIVHDGVVLLSHDNEKFESFLLALSATDGSRLWQTRRKTQRTGYSTPVIFPATDGTS